MGNVLLRSLLSTIYKSLPGGNTYTTCFLDVETLKRLKQEATCYQLKDLETLCDKASDPYEYGSVGDLDTEAYSDFSWKVTKGSDYDSASVNGTSNTSTETPRTPNVAFTWTTILEVRCYFGSGLTTNESLTINRIASFFEHSNLPSKTMAAGQCRKSTTRSRCLLKPNCSSRSSFPCSCEGYFEKYNDFEYEFGTSEGMGPLWFLNNDATAPLKKY